MAMDFGAVSTPAQPLSRAVIQASTTLHAQVRAAFVQAGQRLDDGHAWAKVGIIPMIGQNNVASEQFTLADAVVVNQFARAQGVGQLSMWSLNRDSTCGPPLPTAPPVVQTSCSGIDQGTERFANLLAANLTSASTSPFPSGSGAGRSPTPSPLAETVDDPAHSPFPIWDPLGKYPGGTKIVWHHQFFNARYWTSGFAPATAPALLAAICSTSDVPRRAQARPRRRHQTRDERRGRRGHRGKATLITGWHSRADSGRSHPREGVVNPAVGLGPCRPTALSEDFQVRSRLEDGQHLVEVVKVGQPSLPSCPSQPGRDLVCGAGAGPYRGEACIEPVLVMVQ
jgi:hypothetical protein